MANSYHTITAPSHPTSPALVKKIKASLNSLPPPSHPAYPASMDTLNKHVKEWETTVNKAATTKIHGCLVQETVTNAPSTRYSTTWSAEKNC